MLQTIFDPLDRAPDCPRCRGKKHDVGKHALLDAETAAGIRRRAQPDAIAGHFQRPRDDSVNAERALEIREDIESVFGSVVVGNDAIGFDRRTRISGVTDIDRNPMRRFRESAFRIAIAEGAVARDVTAEAVVKHRRVGQQRLERIDIGSQRRISDLDQIDRVLGLVPVGGDHDGNGFAHIPHPPNGDRPAFDRRLHTDDKAGCQGLDIVAGQDRDNAVPARAASELIETISRMRMRRAQHRGIERAGTDAEIIDEAATPRQQRHYLQHAESIGRPRGAPLCSRLWLGPQRMPSQECPPDHALMASRETVFSKAGRRPCPALSRLANSSHSCRCSAASARKTRDLPEFARRNAGIIAEEAGEMSGIGKPQPRADLAEGAIVDAERPPPPAPSAPH